MKKRKILYLFPLTALILSGCTLEEGLANAKSWAKEMLSPVLNFLRGDTGEEGKKEEKKDDEKPTPSPEGEGEGEGQGGEGQQTEHAGTEADPFSGADAVLVAESLEAGEATADSYYIQGEVTQFQEEFNPSFGNYSFMIKGGFIGWRLKNGPSFAKFNEGDLEIGDTVTMYAQIQAYGEDKLAETKGGYITKIVKPAIDAELVGIEVTGEAKSEYIAGNHYTHEGLVVTAVYDNGQEQNVTSAAEWSYSKEVAEVGDESVTITVTYLGFSESIDVNVSVIAALNYGSLENPLSIEEAMAVIDKESPTSQTLYVTGEVKSNKAYSTKYNNTEIWITDGEHDFELYGCSLPEGFTPAQPVENDPALVGKVVVAHGTAKLYNTTYELDKGCAIDTVSEPAPIVVESVVLSEQALELEVGQQATLSATVNPAKASQEVEWSVEQTAEVVSCDKGKVVALAAGTATVKATSVADPTVSASCVVTVSEATKNLESIALTGTPDKLAYYHGEAYDPTGLKVMAHYDVGEDEDITANSEIVADPVNAAYGDTSVTFTATYANKEAHESFDVTVSYKKGTADLPYTVAEARDAIDNNGDKTGVYATGIVSEIVTAFSSEHKNVSFNISADGTKTADQLQAYRCVAASEDDVAVGDTVTVKGNLKKYNSTYEFDSGCTIENRVQPTVVSVAISGTPTQTEYGVGDSYNHNGLVATATLSNGGQVDVTSAAVWTPSKATAEQGDNEISYTATYGGVESAAFPIEVTITSSPVVVPGSEEQPYTTAQARDAIDNNGNKTGVYTAGIVNRIAYAYSSNNKNMSFYFSDDGSTTNEVEAYKLSAETDPNVEVGDYVVVYGDLTKYNSTYEVNTGCTLATHTKATVQTVTISGTASQTEYAVGASYNRNGLTASAHLSTNVDVDVSDKATWNFDPATATLGDETVSITATYGGVTSAAVVVNVTVTNDTPPATLAYRLVTNASDLTAGDKIVITNAAKTVGLVDYASGNNCKGSDITDTNGVLTALGTAGELTLEDAGNGKFYIKSGNNYLYAASSSGNQLKGKSSKDNTNGVWEFTYNQAGNMSIVASGSSNRNVMQYNPNNGSPIFACYASASQTALQVYRYC